MLKLLLIDNENTFLSSLKDRLLYEGYKVDAYDNIALGKDMMSKENYDVLLCDKECFDDLTSENNLKGWFKGPVLVITNPEICRNAVEMVKRGAYDVINRRPCDLNLIFKVLRECSEIIAAVPVAHVSKAMAAAQAPTVRAHTTKVVNVVDTDDMDADMIGTSDSIKKLKIMIERVALSDARVLITGENGTGKELVAKWVHKKSHRRDMPFVEINCAAIPSELIESELFGHEKGAFTSAVKQRKGRFEQANGGTLFMDEIGDMSMSAQAKVLRALQEHKITRVGGESDINVDVRVVAATNKNLKDEIARGNFREDLYHRLSVIMLHVPSLIERTADIPPLVDHFMNKISAEYGMEPIKITDGAMEELQKCEWTGNVRELSNVIERLFVLCDKEVTAEDVRRYTTIDDMMLS